MLQGARMETVSLAVGYQKAELSNGGLKGGMHGDKLRGVKGLLCWPLGALVERELPLLCCGVVAE